MLFITIKGLGSEKLCFPARSEITIKQLKYCAPGIRQKFHYLNFCLQTVIAALKFQPTKVYISDPLACPAALILQLFCRADFIYHEHDSPPAAPDYKSSTFMRFVLNARKKLAGKSSFCVLPNQERCNEFVRQTGTNIEVLCLWNCPSIEEVSSTNNPNPVNRNEFRILYHGSIVPPRLPLEVLSALSKLPENAKLIMAGYETIGHRDYVKKLFEKARELKLEHRVEYVGVLNRKDLFQLSLRCDVGLAFMPMRTSDINMKHMTGASNKPFDYLACGLALLVSDLRDWNDLFVTPGYGLSCKPQDSESILYCLEWFLTHPMERQAMGEAGRQKVVTAWNYEKQFSVLYSALTGERSDGSNEEPRARV